MPRSDLEREHLLSRLTKEQKERLFTYTQNKLGTVDDWLDLEFPQKEVTATITTPQGNVTIKFEELEARKAEIEEKVEESEDVLVELEETITEKKDLMLKLDEARKQQLKSIQIELDKAKVDEVKKWNEIIEHFLLYPHVLTKSFETFKNNGVPVEFRYFFLIVLANYDPEKKMGIEIRSNSVDGSKFNHAYFITMLKMLSKADRGLLWELTQLSKKQIEKLKKGVGFVVTYKGN